MEQRRAFSELDKTSMWDGWRAGEALSDIGRRLDRTASVIYFALKSHGGIAQRPRKTLGFETPAERINVAMID